MSGIPMVIFISGLVILFVYSLINLIQAFKASILWGLGSLFVPFVLYIFVGMHWQTTKRPFLMSLAGVGLMVLSALIAAMTGSGSTS